MKSLEEAFENDSSTPSTTKTALLDLSQLILDHSYVHYQGSCYKSLIGIPTGGCNSRQTADCLLHRLIKLVKGDIPLWKLISLFKRFIDDIFLLWGGTKRQFKMFVDDLNKHTAIYGISFGDYSLGKSVDFLDTTLTIDSEGFITYTLFKKPTDSRLYLKVGSFHPAHVFPSVAYSQMLRVWKRNDTSEGASKNIEDLKLDLEKCGHKRDELDVLHKKLLTNTITKKAVIKADSVLVAVVDFFQEIKELKTLLEEVRPDISKLVGEETSVLVAARRGTTIGNTVVKNSMLCDIATETMSTQKCSAKKCKSCMLLGNMGEQLIVNGLTVTVKKNLNCKSPNVIYVAQCQLCSKIPDVDDTYTGQTGQPFHKRVNGHRSCFTNPDNVELIEKSALSLHSYNEHRDNFDLNDFKFILHDQTRPRDLNRRESRRIGELRTNVMGLNRMNVQS